MRLIKIIYGSFFMLGIFLIGLNIAGWFFSLRNPEIHEEKTNFKDDITISPEEFYEIINDNEYSDEVYVLKATEAVNQAIAHYWEKPGQEKYNLRVPIYENYVLYAFYRVLSRNDMRHEFCDYKKAVERGVGYCSQESFILDTVLDENLIESNIILYPWLHVVVTARVNQESWWVLDPDYGVVIPHDIQAISSNPDLIFQYYFKAGYDHETVTVLHEIFKTEYIRSESVDEYFDNAHCQIEGLSYFLIWVIPVFLILLGSLPFIRERWGDRE